MPTGCACIRSSIARPEGRARKASVIQSFFNTIEKHVPQLVSWNGGGFDLPVLHYRGLRHGVVASKYWDMGEDDREFKWNNYIGRYHLRHLDLMDLLAMYQPRASAPLDAMAKLCGFPGKLGHGRLGRSTRPTSKGSSRRSGATARPTSMNTYLLYCRFQKMRGGFNEAEYEREIALRAGGSGIVRRRRRAALGRIPRRLAGRSGRMTAEGEWLRVESLDLDAQGVAHDARARWCSSRARCRASWRA